MKRILVIGGQISPSPSANSVCVCNVLHELVSLGYDCHFLGLGEKREDYTHDGIHFHSVKIDKKQKNRFSRLDSFLHLGSLPETEPEITIEKTRYVQELCRKFDFDIVMGVCSSYSNIYSALAVRDANPNIMVGGYYLDTLESLSQLDGLTRKIRDYYSYKGEDKVFQKLDFIILPIASSVVYQQPRYDGIKSKITYAEFPTFIPKATDISHTENVDSPIQAIIIGTLNSTFRNPRKLLSSLCTVCDANKIQLHIDVYGSNDESLFSSIGGASYVTFELHGRVPHSEIDEAIEKTDLLINISNSGILAVPSKIFEYFSSYKPMLSQVSDRHDSALEYYKKYSAGHIYYTFEPEEEQLQKLKSFLSSVKDMIIDAKSVDEAFYRNSPRYVASQLDTIFK